MKYYAVYFVGSGEKIVYTSWNECLKAKKGKHVVFKSFGTRRESLEWLEFFGGGGGEGESKRNIYTDGSCMKGRAGGGVYSDFPIGGCTEWKVMVEGKQTNNRAELTALIKGMELCLEVEEDVIIWTDSTCSLQMIPEGVVKANVDLVEKMRNTWDAVKCSVNVRYIPAHVGIEGNENADRLAKDATRLV